MIAKGLPASPGAAVGQVVFSAEDAEEWHAQGKSVILVFSSPHPISTNNGDRYATALWYLCLRALSFLYFLLYCSHGWRGVFLSKTLLIEIFLSTIYGYNVSVSSS